MFDIGTQELIIIFIVALIVFGPKRLPELGRTLGKGIRELKSALSGVTESIDVDGVEEEIRKARENVVNSLMKEGKIDLGEKGEGKEPAKAGEELKDPSDPKYKEESGTGKNG
ncbi:MAG: twin-arginine translocase subunit TatB [Nitrospirae bacterium]|nr:twin-arginine translocase subunit TatB [Nitrospirota bacterium]